jgi:hypothetical protein
MCGEQLSWLSRGQGIIFLPWCLMCEHGIQHGEPLAHACGQGDFRRFSGDPHVVIEGLEHGIVAHRTQRSHRQRRPDTRASAPHAASTAQGATISIEQGHADQGRNPLLGQSAQRRQWRHQGVRADRPHAWDAWPQVVFRAPHRTGADTTPDLRVKVAPFVLQPADVCLDAWVQASGGRTQPVFLGRQHLDELATAPQEGTQLLCLCLRQRPRDRADGLGNVCQRPGIECIGLG